MKFSHKIPTPIERNIIILRKYLSKYFAVANAKCAIRLSFRIKLCWFSHRKNRKVKKTYHRTYLIKFFKRKSELKCFSSFSADKVFLGHLEILPEIQIYSNNKSFVFSFVFSFTKIPQNHRYLPIAFCELLWSNEAIRYRFSVLAYFFLFRIYFITSFHFSFDFLLITFVLSFH